MKTNKSMLLVEKNGYCKINDIGLEVYINCKLVEKRVRNAMLIQPADYDEAISSDPKTASKLTAIKKVFPNLKLSNIAGETIVSLEQYSSKDVSTSEDMGKILDYPCADEYLHIRTNPDDARFTISVRVNLKTGGNVQIFAFACRSEKHYLKTVDLAIRAEKVLKADPLLRVVVESVEAIIETVMSPKYLIEKLLDNEQLHENDIYQVRDYLWNLSLNNTPYKYDFDNPVHRGIVIGLLSMYDNNPLEPFFPLQFRAEFQKVNMITLQWVNELNRIFAAKTIWKRKKNKTKQV